MSRWPGLSRKSQTHMLNQIEQKTEYERTLLYTKSDICNFPANLSGMHTAQIMLGHSRVGYLPVILFCHLEWKLHVVSLNCL